MADNYGKIQGHFLEMLRDAREVLRVASGVLLDGSSDGADAAAVGESVRATDKQINDTQHLLRRELVVHGTVQGATAFPSMLALMSLSKDVEQIGDYAKGLLDLAAAGGGGSGGGVAEERASLTELRDRILGLLDRASELHKSQDPSQSRAFLDDVDAVHAACGDRVAALLRQEGGNPSVAVLVYRGFQRITRHAGNVVTALIVPLDHLDVFDED